MRVRAETRQCELHNLKLFLPVHTIPCVGNTIKGEGYGIEIINTTRHANVTLL